MDRQLLLEGVTIGRLDTRKGNYYWKVWSLLEGWLFTIGRVLPIMVETDLNSYNWKGCLY